MAIILAIAMMVSLFAGCSKADTTDTTASTEAGNREFPTQNGINGENNTLSIPNHDGSLYEVKLSDKHADASYNEASATKITLKGDSIDVNGSGAGVSGSVVTISATGTYIVSGKLNDGQIIVNNEAKEDIHIVLDGADITCSNSAAIFIQQAGNTKITLVGENHLADVGEYVLDAEEEPTAVLFSKDDLVINGTGSLDVKANYNDGITSKDDLKLINATLTIDAKDDAVVGKDTLAVKDVNLTIKSGGNGLKSSNDTDEDKGIIHVESGIFNIESTGDCFHGVTAVQVLGGEFNLSSKDDGFHSDRSLMLNGGNINITNCYEGLEGRDIFVNDGVIYINSTDDAINAASDIATQQNMSSTSNNGGGRNWFMMGDSGNTLTINGGYICIKAGGDGIDINGTAYINDGMVIVNGPQSGANGSLDYGQEFVVTGGTIITAGSSGMAQVPTATSTVYTVAGRVNGNNGDVIHIEDENGNNVLTFTPSVSFSFFSFTSGELKKDGKYYYSIGGSVSGDNKDGVYSAPQYTAEGELTEFTMTDVVVYVGEGGGGFTGFNPGGGFPGGNFPGGNGGRPEGGNFQKPENGQMPQLPDGMEIPGFDGEMPDFNGELPEGFEGKFPNGEMPQGGFDGKFPGGQMPEGGFQRPDKGAKPQ